jgi:beta-phosphoglucomutase-like phosphatase (HAD superfamily)
VPSRATYEVLSDSDAIDALIFDWDGTLVDSADTNFEALRQSLLVCEIVLDRDWYFARFSMTTPELLHVWQAEFGPLPEPMKMITGRCRDYVIANAVNLVVIEDVAAIARRAHAAGWKLAVGSNASTATLAAGLAATGFDELFSVAVTWSDVAAGKPAPDIFLLAARRLGVAPGACLVYEDAPEGIAAAHAAGMRVVDVREGLAVPARLCPGEA